MVPSRPMRNGQHYDEPAVRLTLYLPQSAAEALAAFAAKKRASQSRVVAATIQAGRLAAPSSHQEPEHVRRLQALLRQR